MSGDALAPKSLRRQAAPPRWAVARLTEVRTAIANMHTRPLRIKASIVSSLDWRSRCISTSGHYQVKLDWSLIELLQIVHQMIFKHDDAPASSGVFSDSYFNELSQRQTAIVGEICRLLCWRCVTENHKHSTVYFYSRFMDYCGSNAEFVRAYVGSVRLRSNVGICAIDLLFNHELAHIFAAQSRADEANLCVSDAWIKSFQAIPEDLLGLLTRGRVSYGEFFDFLNTPACATQHEELFADFHSVMSSALLLDDQRGDSTVLDVFEVYAVMVFLVSWLSLLEDFLLPSQSDDGSMPRANRDFIRFASIRSHFFVPQNILNLMPALASKGHTQDDLGRCLERILMARDILDRSLEQFMYKVINWRFEILKMESEAFWLTQDKDAILDHLRRYPDFCVRDYEAAARIAAGRPRGWTVDRE